MDARKSLFVTIIVSALISFLTAMVTFLALSSRQNQDQSSPKSQWAPPPKRLEVKGIITFPPGERYEKKVWQGKEYRVYEGTVVLTVSSLSLQNVEKNLWVDPQGRLGFSVPDFPVEKLPVKGKVVIQKAGFKTVVFEDLDIQAPSLELPPVRLLPQK